MRETRMRDLRMLKMGMRKMGNYFFLSFFIATQARSIASMMRSK
jgi:hypothetical protein